MHDARLFFERRERMGCMSSYCMRRCGSESSGVYWTPEPASRNIREVEIHPPASLMKKGEVGCEFGLQLSVCVLAVWWMEEALPEQHGRWAPRYLQ